MDKARYNKEEIGKQINGDFDDDGKYSLDGDELNELMSLAIDVELCEHDGVVDRMKQTGKRMQELLQKALYTGDKYDDPYEYDPTEED